MSLAVSRADYGEKSGERREETEETEEERGDGHPLIYLSGLEYGDRRVQHVRSQREWREKVCKVE